MAKQPNLAAIEIDVIEFVFNFQNARSNHRISNRITDPHQRERFSKVGRENCILGHAFLAIGGEITEPASDRDIVTSDVALAVVEQFGRTGVSMNSGFLTEAETEALCGPNR